MLNLYKLIEILVSLQSLVITSMLPVYIPLPFIYKSGNNIELPITWQIPTIILLTLIFHKKVSPLVMLVTIFNASSCDLTAKSSSLIILCLCLNKLVI